MVLLCVLPSNGGLVLTMNANRMQSHVARGGAASRAQEEALPTPQCEWHRTAGQRAAGEGPRGRLCLTVCGSQPQALGEGG